MLNSLHDRLLARPILQEYDTSTEDEPAVNPAELESQQLGTTLWKSQKLVGGRRTLGIGDVPSECR